MPLIKNKKILVGSAVSSDVFNRDFPEHLRSSRERLVHLASPEFGMANFHYAKGVSANYTWQSANKPLAMPFRVFQGMTVYQLGWRNGSGTMTDSVDVGIYDTSFNRKVSGGGTARVGASLIQWVDVTDTFLTPGKYYLCTSANGVTANNAISEFGALSTVMLAGLGCLDSGTNAYPLPNPLTNMVTPATFTSVVQTFIACRVPF